MNTQKDSPGFFLISLMPFCFSLIVHRKKFKICNLKKKYWCLLPININRRKQPFYVNTLNLEAVLKFIWAGTAFCNSIITEVGRLRYKKAQGKPGLCSQAMSLSTVVCTYNARMHEGWVWKSLLGLKNKRKTIVFFSIFTFILITFLQLLFY